jgi:hypothetical protein
VEFAGNSKIQVVQFHFLGNCSRLRLLEIPAGIQKLGEWACASCSALEHVTFAPESKLGTIETGCFEGCTSLTQLEIPAGVAELPGGAKSFKGVGILRAPRGLREELRNASEFDLNVDFF